MNRHGPPQDRQNRGKTLKNSDLYSGGPRPRKLRPPCSEKPDLHQASQTASRHRIGLVRHLSSILAALSPESNAGNPHETWLESLLDESQKALLPDIISLSNGLAMLYQTHRVVLADGRIEASREDVMAALRLLQSELSPSLAGSPSALACHALLIGKKQGFTRRQAMEWCGHGKTQMQRILNELTALCLAERRGYRNRGWRYRMLSQEEARELLFSSEKV